MGAVGLSYSTSFRGVLVGDDLDAIANNQHIRSLAPLSQVLSAPPNTTVAGRPVVALSLALNYWLAPADVRDVFDPMGRQMPAAPKTAPQYRNLWGYHAFNLLVHACAALALFGVTRRTLSAVGTPPIDPALLAFGIALLWAVHPVHTSAVTYIVQRAEALMGLFFLLTLYCAIRAAEGLRHRGWWIAGALAACALGMGSKEVMVVAPVLVTIWLWMLWPGQPAGRARSILLAGLATSWVLLAWLVVGNVRDESVGFGLGGWTAWMYLRTQAGVIVHYLRLAFDPTALAFMYDWPPSPSLASVMLPFAALTGLATLTLVLLLRRNPAGLLGAWFFLLLGPTSSVLPIATEVAAPHRLYLPLAAIVAATVLGVWWMMVRFAPGGALRHAWMAVLLPGLVLGSLTHTRNQDYWSLERLMRDTSRKRPADVRPRVVLGGVLLAQERFGEAEEELRAALANASTLEARVGRLTHQTSLAALAHMYLGSALAAQGNLGEGIPELERALALSPELSEAHALLGEAYASEGRALAAVQSFERAIRAIPDAPPLLARAARLLATSQDDRVRDGQRALEYARRAEALTFGQDLNVLDTLAAAYAEQGQFGEAIATLQRAIALAQARGDSGAVAILRQRLAILHRGLPLREAAGGT